MVFTFMLLINSLRFCRTQILEIWWYNYCIIRLLSNNLFLSKQEIHLRVTKKDIEPDGTTTFNARATAAPSFSKTVSLCHSDWKLDFFTLLQLDFPAPLSGAHKCQAPFSIYFIEFSPAPWEVDSNVVLPAALRRKQRPWDLKPLAEATHSLFGQKRKDALMVSFQGAGRRVWDSRGRRGRELWPNSGQVGPGDLPTTIHYHENCWGDPR